MADKLVDECIYLRINELKKGNIQLTDATNAERLVREHGKDIRFNPAWKKWVVWNGRYWETDDGNAMIFERCLDMVRNIYGDIIKTDDHRERIEIEKYAMMSESARRQKACVEVASWKKDLYIDCEKLDHNPWLINLKNGTIDMLTWDFTEHKKDEMITKIADVEYNPKADCPLWKHFILEIMNYNADLIKFVQTAIGWSLTGDISEQTMFILYGTGANGKSTFLNTIMHILGDFATAASIESFMRKNGDQYTNDIARLRGTRFVTTTEAEQGRRLSEPLIKKITGNDQMTARFLYGEFFNFTPTFKIWMATNHKPIIKGTDHGIWRRIKLIPFTTRIPAEKQDKRLEEKLKTEASGILNWLLEGTARWFKEGLVVPEDITNATDEYRGEMDVIGNFLKERCIMKEGISIRIRELFKAYQDWCDESKEHCVTERSFSMRLKDLGYEQCRTSEARFWAGLGLRVYP